MKNMKLLLLLASLGLVKGAQANIVLPTSTTEVEFDCISNDGKTETKTANLIDGSDYTLQAQHLCGRKKAKITKIGGKEVLTYRIKFKCYGQERSEAVLIHADEKDKLQALAQHFADDVCAEERTAISGQPLAKVVFGTSAAQVLSITPVN